MLDCAGPLYLKRNFSVLGFSCDNWLNHSVNLTILPVGLTGPAGELPIDDFSPERSGGLWTPGLLVREADSKSDWALRIVCAANTSSCGAVGADGSCPAGCVSDGKGWCQAIASTFVNRLPSQRHPLPTERDAGNVLDVREYEAFDLRWKMSADYRPPLPDARFPVGMQTVDFAPQSNRVSSATLSATTLPPRCRLMPTSLCDDYHIVSVASSVV